MSDTLDTLDTLDTQIPDDLKMKIASLQEAILAAHPTLPILLQQIHKQLKADPAIVTILSEEDIGILVSGLKQQTKTEITASAMKKKTSLKSATLDML